MKSITLKERHDKKYKDGYLLLEENDIDMQDPLEEGEIFLLKNQSGDILGQFYYGRQNRGAGYKIADDLKVKLDVSFFKQLFEAALKERQSLYNAAHTNAFRLYNGEGDGLGGFTIDNYNGHLLIQWYSEGIYVYRDIILQAMDEVFSFQTIHEKLRFKQDVPTQQVTKEEVEFPVIVMENGIFYLIHFYEGPMTGIFLDQRDVRNKIMQLPVEGKMLNLFAYSGGFSLAAAKNGMMTTNVDIAKRSLELIEQNFGINELDFSGHTNYSLDVFDMFKYCRRHRLTYDLIVIDPPSFSRSKKRRFSVRDNYHELIEGALTILNKNGYLVLSTNASNYPLHQFKKMITETLDKQVSKYEITDVMGLPKDFKTTNAYKPSKYLKVVFVKVVD